MADKASRFVLMVPLLLLLLLLSSLTARVFPNIPEIRLLEERRFLRDKRGKRAKIEAPPNRSGHESAMTAQKTTPASGKDAKKIGLDLDKSPQAGQKTGQDTPTGGSVHNAPKIGRTSRPCTAYNKCRRYGTRG